MLIDWARRAGAPRVALVAVLGCLVAIVLAFVRALTAGDFFHTASLGAAGVLLGMGALGLLYAWRLGASGPPS